jgi:predicted metalloprotease
MCWQRGARSANVESGNGPRFPAAVKIGLSGTVLLLLLSVVTRQNFFALRDPGSVPGSGGPGGSEAPAAYRPSPAEEQLVDFVSFVLDDVQGTWARELPRVGQQYRDAKLVLFHGVVRSGCGLAETATGPFYCPEDQKVYIDLGFYQELRKRFGAPGDFAQAYVIAHEIGHHVQDLLGLSEQVHELQEARRDQADALSVRLELQADCLAGVWAHSTEQRNILEDGDAEEAISAAAAAGDHHIQRAATGRVNPETWTHGSSRQRVAWFRQGLESGRIEDCDTFRTRQWRAPPRRADRFSRHWPRRALLVG